MTVGGERGPPGLPVTAEAGRYSCNLLILHTPTMQDIADWVTVKEKIAAAAPDIDVRIDSNLEPSPDVGRWQVSRPSVVFSPYRLVAYQPPGGTVFAGQDLGKGMQWLRMQPLGLPVPPMTKLKPGLRLKPEWWGEHVIVKPTHGYLGYGVRLVRTDDLEGRYAELSDSGRRRMLVQKFIDHVDAEGRPYVFRVLTMFGRPLYLTETKWVEPRRPLAEIAADPDGKIASNTQGIARQKPVLVEPPDVLALAERVATAFPEIPCLAQDIIRRTGTDELFILETNPAGYSWHLSSDWIRQPRFDQALNQAKYTQFNALDVVAEQLVAKTRATAS